MAAFSVARFASSPPCSMIVAVSRPPRRNASCCNFATRLPPPTGGIPLVRDATSPQEREVINLISKVLNLRGSKVDRVDRDKLVSVAFSQDDLKDFAASRGIDIESDLDDIPEITEFEALDDGE